MLSEKEVLMVKKIDEGTGASGPGSGVGFRKNTGGKTPTTTKKKNDDGSAKFKETTITAKREFVVLTPTIERSRRGSRLIHDIQIYTEE